jgi:hypothetical protein
VSKKVESGINMSKELLTRCGYRCDLCLAYKGNVDKEDRRAELSDGWEKYFGFRIPADKIYCEGCMTPGNPKLIDSACPVRPCVIKKGLNNCSQCPQYPCETINQRFVVYEKVVKGRKDVTEKDRTLFIKPYENKVRLDELRRHKTASPDSSNK